MTDQEKRALLDIVDEMERRKLAESIDCSQMTREEANEAYRLVMDSGNKHAQRKLCKTDLFFLLTVALKRKDINRDWLYDRCREVQASPNGHLDLWARDHYKSTVITYAKTIQDILADPEVTVGIFSHTRPMAKGFLEQIKREFESNEYLKSLFPDVLYDKPQTESPKWSLDGGIVVKRKTNPKEATVEGWGIVDGQPTGKHFRIRVYDDVVTRESVSTPEQIKKTTECWELSLNLGTQNDGQSRYIGTRYHLNDSYRTMMDRGSVVPRIRTATHDGTMDGEPVLLTKEKLLEKRRDMGPYTFSCQLLQNPVADKAMSFKAEWLRYYQTPPDYSKWNVYILVDPASSKKETADYTTMKVIGLAPDRNYYKLAAVRDRMNLTQRANKLFELHRQFNPKAVGYEKYGMQSDIDHMQGEMERRNYRFVITELGGTMAKEDRIRRLVPIYEQGRMWMPERMTFVDCEGVTRDYVQLFRDNEYLAFPVCTHDDMLDCEARILDPMLGADFPKAPAVRKVVPYHGGSGTSWMG